MSCIITNFLLHRTGWFHTSKMRSSTHFSDDPNAEGVVTLKPDGTLAIEKMDLDSKVGQLKTLFFATDKPIPREVRTYFQRFQGYRAEQDESGNFNLIFYHTSVEPELIRIDPVDSSNFPEIMELFAEKNIAADEVLIVDDALIAKTAAIIATQDQKDPEIIRSIKELRTCPDLTQIKCLDLASHMFMSTEEDEIKISQCPSLEFVDLHTSKPLARLSAQAWKNLREIKLSDALQLGNCRSLEVLNIKYLNRAEDQLFPSDFQSNLREVYVYSARPKIQESFLSQIENPDLVSLMSSSEFTPLCLTRSHARVLISGITLGESKDKNSFPNLMYLDISETRSELDTVTLLSQTSFELLKLGLNVLKRACETSALTLKARTLILDLNFLAANLSSLNYKAEKLFLLTSYLSPAKAGVLVFLHHKFGDFSHIHLSARFVNRETHHLLSELQKLSAGKFTFSYVFHELSTPADSVPGARTLNPLAFDPSDSSAWRAQAIFVGLHGPVSPSDYLKNFYQFDETLSVMIPLKFEGKDIPLPGSDTRLSYPNEYQGRLNVALKAREIFPLPGLPGGEMVAIQLPPDCTLYQDERTKQYGLLSPTYQSFLLEWKIQAKLPIREKRPAKNDLFEGLTLNKTDSGWTLVRNSSSAREEVIGAIDWPVGMSDLEKAQALAGWISKFKSEDGKRPGETLTQEEHLNTLLREQRGRCSERSFLFTILMSLEAPGLKTYYVDNDLHAMAFVVTEKAESFCFNLGGVPIELDLVPRPTKPIDKIPLEALVLRDMPEEIRALKRIFEATLYYTPKRYSLNMGELAFELNH